jgi:hypothetical protein
MDLRPIGVPRRPALADALAPLRPGAATGAALAPPVGTLTFLAGPVACAAGPGSARSSP